MPNHKSCKKRMQLAEEARVINHSVRSSIRTGLKAVRSAKTKEEALAAMPGLYSLLDKAAKSHRAGFSANRAANSKSKVSKIVNGFDAAK